MSLDNPAPIDKPVGSTPGIWKEVQTVTLTGTATILAVDNIPNSSLIKFFWRLIPNGGTNALLRFNDDTGSNYADRIVDDDGTTQDNFSQPLVNLSVGGGIAENELFEGTITNVSGREKLLRGELLGDQAIGGVTPPRRRHINAKWTNTGLITKISIQATAGSYLAGSELSVFIRN